MAAPAFVAAALGDAMARFSVRNDTWYVARRRDVRVPSDIVCGLAVTEGRAEPEVLPRDKDSPDLVLVEASRPVRAVVRRPPALTDRYPIRAVLGRVWRRVRFVLALFAVVLLVTATVLAAVNPDVGGLRAMYTAVLVAIGGTDVNLGAPAEDQVILFILAIVSFLLIPFLIGGVVDAVVKARLDLAEGAVPRRASGHVVVVGLGGVGSSVIQMLYDQGVDVVAVDRTADARGAQLARNLRIPLIIGDATRMQTLPDASVPTCRALMAITSDDVTNLETALIGRAIPRKAPGQLKVVLRLFDGEFAARIQRAFNLGTSRSVSNLAVPSFAARMLGKELDTIAVGRRVLLVAELEIKAHSTLASGCTVGDLLRPGEGLFLGLITNDGKRPPSTTALGRRLHYGEKLLVVATPKGLARLSSETATPPASQPHPPIVIFESPLTRPTSTQIRDLPD